MPTYEYACKDCGERFEVVQSFTDDPLQTCETCKGRLRKIFSASGIIFKGSGYYVTDTRGGESSSSGSGSNGSSKESAKDSSKESTSTEGSSKSESKGDSKGTGGDSSASSGSSSGSSSTDSKSS